MGTKRRKVGVCTFLNKNDKEKKSFDNRTFMYIFAQKTRDR